jgi:lipid-binding SYLF domain-containing protein
MLLAAAAVPALGQVRETKRLDNCERVLREVMDMPESIPRDLLDKAECVAVIPGVKKAALGVGGRFGKGAVVCRSEGGRGPWGPPVMVGIGGASIGFQIGGQSSDFVFLIMNPKGVDHLLKNQFTLGADVSVAAGPKGRSAEAGTDVLLNAEILTYSRSKGLFAGVSLEGAVVKQDKGANQALYGGRISPRDLLMKPGQRVPAAAKGLVNALKELSPKNAADR